MARSLAPIRLYAGIARTYAAWAPSLLLLATIVFVPLGLVHALTIHAEVGAFELASGAKLAAALSALLALTATGLLGEVFYAGAVGILLTHSHEGAPPSMAEIARRVNYLLLIAIDLLYAAAVGVGLVALIVPGVLAFVYFGLAAPVAEIERLGVRAAFARSASLVRNSFWAVLAVLVPIELFGNGMTRIVSELTERLLGDTLLSEWLADTLANVAFTPLYAVAVVLIALELIHERDASAARLHSAPAAR